MDKKVRERLSARTALSIFWNPHRNGGRGMKLDLPRARWTCEIKASAPQEVREEEEG